MKSKSVLCLLSTICALTVITIQSVNAASKDKPNVIIICANDLGKGMLSAYGQKHFTTPNIDLLINGGVSFSHAYGGSTSTYGRVSLFTGYFDCRKNLWRFNRGGVYAREDTSFIEQNEKSLNENNILLPANDLYLPQVFNKAGYITGEIGVIEWGHSSSRLQVEQHGWDYYYGFLDHSRARGMYPPFIFENGQTVRLEGNTRADCGMNYEPETEQTEKLRHDTTGKKTYAPDLFINKTLEFIREFKNNSFFLMYNANLPAQISIPAVHPEIAGNEALSPLEKEYASMVKLLDDQVGKILSELRTLGIEDKTLIIFTSDNGHEIYYQQDGRVSKPYGDKRSGERFDNSYFKFYSDRVGDIFNGNAGLAGIKESNLEGGIVVPLTYYWKGVLHSRVSDEFTAACDLLPTMAELTGVKLESSKDGISYLKTVTKGAKLPKNRHIVISSDEGPVLLTNEGWKLRYFRPKSKFELYNVRKDPQEKYDVILKNPQIAADLEQILLKELNGSIENGVAY
ncbi:MAG: sulfatase-like hydrolase/transferase [Tannerella sp.]|jgi:arylsulfatase A-like enzyme|nr:sulfatase-like hydrolase/transferase [Tannerella sp.]